MNLKLKSAKGFSLLEILIAFSILALSLGILLGIFSGGLRQAIVSEEYQHATTIAQSKLAMVGTEVELQEGEVQGEIEGKYFWSVRAVLFDNKDEGFDEDKMNVLPYLVTSTVEWEAGKDNNRRVELITLKLANKDDDDF